METKQNNQTTWLWIAAAAGAVLLCLCVILVVAAGGAFFFLTTDSSSIEEFPSGPVSVGTVEVATPLPEASSAPPTLQILPGPDSGETPRPDASTELAAVVIPPRDRYDLAVRFLGIDPETVEPPTPIEYEVGAVESFYVTNHDLDDTLEVDAELVYINERVYVWIEQGVNYDMNDVRQSADFFSEQTIPTTRAYFGMEASPGIDGNERLHILHSVELGSRIAGYFGSDSSYPQEVAELSNEKEIFYINIGNTPPGTAYYDGVLTHEYQHMIQDNVDGNEELWLNEGMSEAATFLNGLGHSDFASSFLIDSDLGLTDWPEGGGAAADYGAAYLYVIYFVERFGQDALHALASHPENGFKSMDEVLDSLDAGITADQIFIDWTVANLLNDASFAGGIYGYPSLPDMLTATAQEFVTGAPHDSGWQEVRQYGTDYIELNVEGTITIDFEGVEGVNILPTSTRDTDDDPATDDRFVWWSNRADESNMTLTRSVDLTGVDAAVLSYDIWFDIEELWDFGYLTITTDGGDTWEIIPTPHTTTENPYGNSYGAGYTGRSSEISAADENGWLHEEIDLSAYAGQEIMLRFEMLTDEGVNRPGFAIDNLCIDTLDWCDNAEEGTGDWDARGFVHIDNLLPQRYSVQVVVPGQDEVLVLPMALDEQNVGTLTFDAGSDPVVLIVSGLTRYTTVPATYRFTVTAGP